MQRLNASGQRGIGGRIPRNSRLMLREWLARGWESGGPELAAFAKDLESGYLSDLGGDGNCSAMDRSLVRRLVGNDLDYLILTAQFDKAAKLSTEKRLALMKARAGNAATHSQLIKTLGGPSRRPATATGSITIRRFQEAEPVETVKDSEPPEADANREGEE